MPLILHFETHHRSVPIFQSSDRLAFEQNPSFRVLRSHQPPSVLFSIMCSYREFHLHVSSVQRLHRFVVQVNFRAARAASRSILRVNPEIRAESDLGRSDLAIKDPVAQLKTATNIIFFHRVLLLGYDVIFFWPELAPLNASFQAIFFPSWLSRPCWSYRQR